MSQICHFVDEKTEAQKDEVTCPKLYSKFTGSVAPAHDFVPMVTQKLALNFQHDCGSDTVDSENVYNKGKY